MVRLARRIRSTRFQGIRFRLAVGMALALLPILALSAVQSRTAYSVESEGRRSDLLLAAERTSLSARARLDSITTLLEVLRPDAAGPGCDARLRAVEARLEGSEGIFRFDAQGRLTCASNAATPEGDAAPGPADALRTVWFDRVRAGEAVVLTRAPETLTREPSMVVAVRAQRPLGDFDGAMVALIPLSELRPDVSDRALPPGSQAAVTDADGAILAATDPTAFDLSEPSLNGWVARARADSNAALFSGRAADGHRRLYAGAALAGRDVYVLLAAPDPGLWSWARINATAVLLLPLMAWLVALLAVMVISDRIVIRWLDYLERIAALYARGRYSVRPVQATHAPAEIRNLARTLDHMAEAISARDRSLTDSLGEKDALMREIHHRVKNNLQIISSMLNLQQRALADPAAKAAMGDTRQRIGALALIYRTLYQGEDIRRADLGQFIDDLVRQMIAGESRPGSVIDSSVEVESLIIDPDRLAPVALWLVEAVSNALKHAFNDRGGKLAVRFHFDRGQGVIEVEDDGPGSDKGAPQGVGATLMTAFARQLRGESLNYPAPKGGTVARLTFEIDSGQAQGTA